MNRILRNTATVGAFTALSRVLGLVREMLQSRFIGAGVEQSAFTLAFALPNMARKLFGEGALTAAFVPVFKGEVEARAMENARRLARAVMTMTLLMLGAIVALAFLGLETAVHFRFGLEMTERTLLTVRLVKTLLPYMIFICGAAFGMGVLNAMGRFKASSAMPCLLNVFWIGMLLWICFHPELKLDQRIHRVAMAILVAGVFQMAFMLWRMHCAGITPGLTLKGWADAKVRLVWKNTAIAAVGAGAVQFNYMLDQVLGQVAAPWAAGVTNWRLSLHKSSGPPKAFRATLQKTLKGKHHGRKNHQKRKDLPKMVVRRIQGRRKTLPHKVGCEGFRKTAIYFFHER